MREEVIQKILKILKCNSNMSATALAKECGFSKGSVIENELRQLKQQKQICENRSGRFPVYSISTESVTVSSQTQKTEIIVEKKISTELPAASDALINNYKITNVKINGKKSVKITCPNGKALKMDPDGKLLVINGEPEYVVHTPEQILSCIKQYSTEKGLVVFTVDDISQNKKIANEKDLVIEDKHILFLSIKKHNKAA